MKFSYTLLKKIFPDLPSKKKVIDLLNLYSFETEDLGGDILDISLPTNRYSDAASHFGIARELAVILNKKFNYPIKFIKPPLIKKFIKVKIENENDCSRYLAYYFEISKVGESSQEIKKILKSCGINPINNIVDIANLVMLETGQPLHIFDADKLSPQNSLLKTLIVRRAKNGEKIETLDNQIINLNKDILVISDIESPLAIAGIKGGLLSGIDKNTKRIILEAANFDSVLIYKTSKMINLRTDASIRFSHNISNELVKIGADRAAYYFKKIGAKLIDSFEINNKKYNLEIINFNIDQYEKLIGEKIEFQKAKKYFISLGFEVKELNKKNLQIKIPGWRTDILDFEDLAEEVLRFEGINQLKPARPQIELLSYFEDNVFILKDKIRNILTKLNLSEVYNHSLIGENDVEIKELGLKFNNKLIEVEYPVSKDFKYLRPSLLIWLKKNLIENSKFFENVSIFEIGKIFYKEQNNLKEKLSLGLGILTNKYLSIFEMKGVVDSLLKQLGIGEFLLVEDQNKIKIEIDFNPVGFIYHFKNKKNQYFALTEIDAEYLLKFVEEENEFKPISKYPAVIRDISVLVPFDIKIGKLVEFISEISSLIYDVDLIDEYFDPVFGNKQSLTFRIVFQSKDRTLTDN
ncbi:MAG: phenylalanine--tRNA ligase subunit beta, partial [Patescibacteria group bacterium]|nr:phenylalanine--tRNA ligase subunit beta [Patescibacteria group bacterium]